MPDSPSAKGKPGIDFVRATCAAKFILAKTKLKPRVGVVLGSGLGAFADELVGAVCMDYKKIPHFPHSSSIGHAGRMVIGTVENMPVAAMQGRVHLYEGYTAREVAFPIRVMARMGIRAIILTNAAGAINRDFRPGNFVLIQDHINLQGVNPLIGADEERFGPRFPDMTHVYAQQYRVIAMEEGKRLGMELSEGVYAAMTGPSYETPAEIRSLRAIGADLVGMSTVPEAIAAAHMGIRVLGISCVTNMAAGAAAETGAGTPDRPVTSEKVLETTERVKEDFAALLRAVVPRMNEDVE